MASQSRAIKSKLHLKRGLERKHNVKFDGQTVVATVQNFLSMMVKFKTVLMSAKIQAPANMAMTSLALLITSALYNRVRPVMWQLSWQYGGG